MDLETHDFWRALILYGKNVSTYKMGLGKCLLSYSHQNKDRISLDDLAYDFYKLYVERVKDNKPQGSIKGRATYLEQEIKAVLLAGKSESNALEIIKRKSLSDMVLKKFHNLNKKPIEIKFYTISESGNYLNLNRELLGLINYENNHFLEQEIDSRWALLEHAFHDVHKTESLDVDEYREHIINSKTRKNLTSVIGVIEGYQQGYCFYCSEGLYDIEVDHVIPRNAIQHDQIWNLVLSHSLCNQDKSDNIPSWNLVEKLIKRNEFFIHSSHPLKDTLIKHLGDNTEQRRINVEKEYQYAKKKIVRMWRGIDNYDPSNDEYFKKWVNYFGSKIQKSGQG